MRTLPADITTAIASPLVSKMIFLVRLDFDAGSLCYNSSFNNLDYGGKTYYAAGTLGSISPTSESGGIKSAEMSVSLSGVKPAVVAALTAEPYLNRPAFIHMALLGADDSFDTDNVRLMLSGKMDSVSGNQGETPSFSVSIRSRLSDWERGRSIKYTDADQQRLYPGDRGMEYIPQISQKKIIWPLAGFLADSRDYTGTRKTSVFSEGG